MSIRTWIFAALVALGMALNLGLVSLRIAQTGEETVRARVAAASVALKTQLDLLDARLSPRAVAANPDLIDATRPPVDPTQPLTRPDERALRAAASVVAPEPDLLIVATGQGAIVSRRGKPAAGVDDLASLPLAKAALAGSPAPAFASYDGAVFRVSAARIPGNAAAVIVGMLVDDRLASQLRSQVDADVSLLQGEKLLASSLPAQGESRAQLQRWAKAPAAGYGVLQVRVPVLGSSLSGKLPRGTSRWATRGALVALDSGVQAALTVPASAYLGWLGRYQAFYLLALLLLVIVGFLWGLSAPKPGTVAVVQLQEPPAPQRRSPVPPPSLDRPEPSLLGADVSSNTTPPKPVPPADVPWSSPPEEGKPESLDPALPPALEAVAPPLAPVEHSQELGLPGKEEHKLDPIWHGDPFSPTAGQFVVPTPEPEVPGLQPEEHAPKAELLPEAALEPEPEPAAAPRAQQPKDFSFAGLLDEAHATSPGAAREPRASLSQDYPDRTNPGAPSDELLAHARDEKFAGFESPSETPFPGDEPTRIEPVSAALLDKLRERDEELSATTDPDLADAGRVADDFAAREAEEHAAAGGSALDHAETQPTEAEQAALEEAAAAHSAADQARSEEEQAASQTSEQSEADQAAEQAAQEEQAAAQAATEQAAVEAEQALAEQAAAEQAAADQASGQPMPMGTLVDYRPPPPAAHETLSDFRPLAPHGEADPDEQHWHETYDRFRELKAQLGEPADRISFDRFAAKLRKNRSDLLAKHSCKGVRFSVYEKDGKAAIKASAIR